MSAIQDGGPAFPRGGGNSDGPNVSEWWTAQSGMSLRDYFAAAALQALITKSPLTNVEGSNTSDTLCRCVVGSYDYADAMLAEREKSKQAA